MIVNFSKLSPTQIYFLMTQSIVPRPIAWVLTENDVDDPAHQFNLAPFSFFNAVSAEPPLLMLSIGVHPDGREKDTLVNIQRTGKLMVHISSEEHLDAVNLSSASLDYANSEVLASSLDTSEFIGFELPRLTNVKIALACTLDHIYPIGTGQQRLIFAQLQAAYYDDSITHLDEKERLQIDGEALSPLARFGGRHYGYLGQYVSRTRPQ